MTNKYFKINLYYLLVMLVIGAVCFLGGIYVRGLKDLSILIVLVSPALFVIGLILSVVGLFKSDRRLPVLIIFGLYSAALLYILLNYPRFG